MRVEGGSPRADRHAGGCSARGSGWSGPTCYNPGRATQNVENEPSLDSSAARKTLQYTLTSSAAPGVVCCPEVAAGRVTDEPRRDRASVGAVRHGPLIPSSVVREIKNKRKHRRACITAKAAAAEEWQTTATVHDSASADDTLCKARSRRYAQQMTAGVCFAVADSVGCSRNP